MVKTDGYLTTEPDGNWLTSNTGSGNGGVTTPGTKGVYARCEHPEAPIAGTKVDANGQVSEGPKIEFTDPGGVLNGAAEEESDRPFIVWAGVSPLSLKEALIVWNTNIVLLNKSGIEGGEVTTIAGRLMIIKLDTEVKINGKDKQNISIPPGAIGYYKPPEDDEGDDEDAPCPPENEQTTNEGGGSIEDPEDPELPCDCTEIETGEGGDSGGGGSGNNLDAMVFSTICNPSAQCSEFAGNTAKFIVNNGMEFPVRCTHPFYLVKLKICGCGSCNDDAKVWQAAMNIYGGVLPGEIFPLDQLLDIPDPCDITSMAFPNGYPGTLLNDVACANPCPTASVQFVGRYGGVVSESGRWEHPEPGYAGQPVLWNPECETVCGETCQATVIPDSADAYVPEDIIKPIERTVPVSFFESWIVTTTEITIPSTLFSTELTLVTTCLTETVEFVTAVTNDTVIFPTGDGVLLSEALSAEIVFPTTVSTDVVTLPAGTVTGIAQVFTEECTITEDINESVETFISGDGDLVVDVDDTPVTLATTAFISSLIYISSANDISTLEKTELQGFEFAREETAFQLLQSVGIEDILVQTADGSLVQTAGIDLVTFPTEVFTGEIQAPIDPFSAIESTETVPLNIITELLDEPVAFITGGNVGVVDSLGQDNIVLATAAGAPTIQNVITAGVEDVNVATAPFDVVTAAVTGQITYAGPQTGQLVLNTGLGQITGVNDIGSTSLTIPVGEGALISSFSTIEVVLCSSGSVVTVGLVADLQTVAAGAEAINIVTDVGAGTPVQAITAIELGDVDTLVTDVAFDVDIGPFNLVTEVDVTAATPQGITIPDIGTFGADIVTELQTVPLNNFLDAAQIVTGGNAAPVSPITEIVQTEVPVSNVQFATGLGLQQIELVTALTLISEPRAMISAITSAEQFDLTYAFDLQDYTVDVVTDVVTTSIEAITTTYVANVGTLATLNVVTDIDLSPPTDKEITFLSGGTPKVIDIVTSISTEDVGTQEITFAS